MSRTPPSPQVSHWKRRWLWYVLAAAIVLLPVGVYLAMRAGSGTPNLTSTEKQVLEKLAAYGGRHELDTDGHVVRLILEGEQVTDEALAEVHTLPHLRRLSLHNSSVTDQGLLAVVKCKRLQNLGLTNTKVTDAGLARLHQMTSLQNVWVSENDKLTPRGIAALRRALPATKVHVMSKRTDSKKDDKSSGGKKPAAK